MQILRQMAVLIGCFLGGFIAVQLAQSWTTPRTWVTGEVVSAGQMNTHVRDNLGYLYTALATLDASQTTSGTFAVARIPNLAASQITSGTFGQDRLATNSVGTAQLRTATGSSSNSTVAVHATALFPQFHSTGENADGDTVGLSLESTPSSSHSIAHDSSQTGSEVFSTTWTYITSSDEPSIWVMIGSAGDIVSVWEAEDPVGTGDAPLGDVPANHRAVNIGVPSFALLQVLYDALTVAQQQTALDALRATVVTRRGWLAHLTTLGDLASIETRYEPSGRHWALRALAEAIDLPVGEYVATRLRVDVATDTWVVGSG